MENHNGIASAILCLFYVYHIFLHSQVPIADSSLTRRLDGRSKSSLQVIEGVWTSFATYFKKPGVWIAIIFHAALSLARGFLIKMCTPFLVDPKDKGGLGTIYRRRGSCLWHYRCGLFLTIGGILGGIYSSKVGLKKALWLMAGCMTLPCLTFVYLAIWQPENFFIISTCIVIEQFGYGFGFTAYMLYMMYFSEGEFKTSHYAICTAFMALSMMIPGMFAGYIQEAMGYSAILLDGICLLHRHLIVTFLADRKIDPDYGLK